MPPVDERNRGLSSGGATSAGRTSARYCSIHATDVTIPIEEREKAVELALTTRRADRAELLAIIERDIAIDGTETVVVQQLVGRLVELRQALGMPVIA